MRRYRVIVVDPPWPVEGPALRRRIGPLAKAPGVESRWQSIPYRRQQLSWIRDLPVVRDLAASDCWIVLWTPTGHVVDALAVLDARGEPATEVGAAGTNRSAAPSTLARGDGIWSCWPSPASARRAGRRHGDSAPWCPRRASGCGPATPAGTPTPICAAATARRVRRPDSCIRPSRPLSMPISRSAPRGRAWICSRARSTQAGTAGATSTRARRWIGRRARPRRSRPARRGGRPALPGQARPAGLGLVVRLARRERRGASDAVHVRQGGAPRRAAGGAPRWTAPSPRGARCASSRGTSRRACRSWAGGAKRRWSIRAPARRAWWRSGRAGWRRSSTRTSAWRARGRWERIEALKERMPYLRYVATLDGARAPTTGAGTAPCCASTTSGGAPTTRPTGGAAAAPCSSFRKTTWSGAAGRRPDARRRATASG